MGVIEVSFTKGSVVDLEIRKYKYIFISRIGVVIEFRVVQAIRLIVLTFIRVIQVDVSQSMINTVQMIHTDIGFRHVVTIYFEIGRGDVE